MQEVDAERRIQILRGERPPTPPPPPSPHETATRQDRKTADDSGRLRKRRRLAGEDDTDRDIRLAREDAVETDAKREELALAAHKHRDVHTPLLDGAGHFSLFPGEARKHKAEKHAEAEAEAARKKRSYEDQYTMRFSNAAGFNEKAGRSPWYSSAAQDARAPGSMPEKDVWGNEDPRRREREKARLDSSDPLAAMKRGIRQLKATELGRKRWNEEKRKELEALKAEDRHRSNHRRRRRSASMDSFEDFKLDAPSDPERADKDRSSSQRRYRRHRREPSRDRSRSHRHSSHRSYRHRHSEAEKAVS